MDNSMEARKERAVAKIENNYLLLEVYKKERKNIDNIINQALNYPFGANHWTAYEALKKQSALFVGWDAADPEFAHDGHYQVMVDFIDYLLPEVQDQDDIEEYPEFPEISTQPDPDEVEAWHESAKQIYLQMKEEHQKQLGPKSEKRLLIESIFTNPFEGEE